MQEPDGYKCLLAASLEEAGERIMKIADMLHAVGTGRFRAQYHYPATEKEQVRNVARFLRTEIDYLNDCLRNLTRKDEPKWDELLRDFGRIDERETLRMKRNAQAIVAETDVLLAARNGELAGRENLFGEWITPEKQAENAFHRIGWLAKLIIERHRRLVRVDDS